MAIADVLGEVAHRPWPLPSQPWVLAQAWNDLLFAHWRVSRDGLRALVPTSLELDAFDGDVWLTVSPFLLTDMSPRGVPALPWISSFHEINVRTYVVTQGIPGIYFFSLDANSALAVTGASALFHLPYYLAVSSMNRDEGRIWFESHRARDPGTAFAADYAPAGAAIPPQAGTLDYFLTERYCLYAIDTTERLYRVEIHHPPWQLSPAAAVITRNTMADAAGLRVPAKPERTHFARRQDVLTWPPHLVG